MLRGTVEHLRRYLLSSIGKKQLVAVSGLLLVGFLFTHLAGNLAMYGGQAKFDGYAEFLEHQPWLVPAELALAALFLLHVAWGLRVSWENLRARPERYAAAVALGGRTWGSATMKYTGLMTLVFLCVHIWTFKLGQPEGRSLFDWVLFHFRKPWYAGFYVLAMITLGLHLSHGVKSAFQTLGVNHPRYTPAIEAAGVLVAAALAAGFGSLPVWGFLRGAP